MVHQLQKTQLVLSTFKDGQPQTTAPVLPSTSVLSNYTQRSGFNVWSVGPSISFPSLTEREGIDPTDSLLTLA